MTTEGKKQLYVSIDQLETLVCDYGKDFCFDTWYEVFEGKGFKWIPHKEAVKWFIQAEKQDPVNRKGWGLFLRTLPHVPKFLELQPTEEELESEKDAMTKAIDEGWIMTFGNEVRNS